MNSLCHRILAQSFEPCQVRYQYASIFSRPVFSEYSVSTLPTDIIHFESDVPEELYTQIMGYRPNLDGEPRSHSLNDVKKGIIKLLSTQLPDIIEEHKGRTNDRGQRYYSTVDKLAKDINQAWRDGLRSKWGITLDEATQESDTRAIMIQILEQEVKRQRRIQECNEIIWLEERSRYRASKHKTKRHEI